MDARTAKLLALSALLDEAEALADNGDILPTRLEREAMEELAASLYKRIDRMNGWETIQKIFKDRAENPPQFEPSRKKS